MPSGANSVTSDEIEKSVLVARIGVTLRHMSDQLREIEEIVVDSVANAPPEARRTIQELDRTIQTMDCLAACLDTISETDPLTESLSEGAAFSRIWLPSVVEQLRTAQASNHRDLAGEPDLW